MTVALALDSAGMSDPGVDGSRRLRAALRQVWVPATRTIMPWNGIRFDGSGQNELAAGVVEQRGPAGFQVVFPRELSAVPVSWRSPGH